MTGPRHPTSLRSALKLFWKAFGAALALLLALGAIAQLAVHADERTEPHTGEVTLSSILSLLESSGTGRALLQKAMREWHLRTSAEIAAHLKWGSTSRTDAVLIRHYNPETGRESRERRVSIYLRKEQSISNIMLDLAHELVHATSKPSWDPYDPNLTAGGYIRATIEGEGGEVEAVHAECQVSREVYGESSGSEAASRCRRYWKGPALELIRKDFYRVGRWMEELKRSLGPETETFPMLSHEKPTLYSSTGGAPYPVALFEEYRQMTAVACENTRRRAPASTPGGVAADDENAQLFLHRRCKN